MLRFFSEVFRQKAPEESPINAVLVGIALLQKTVSLRCLGLAAAVEVLANSVDETRWMI